MEFKNRWFLFFNANSLLVRFDVFCDLFICIFAVFLRFEYDWASLIDKIPTRLLNLVHSYPHCYPCISNALATTSPILHGHTGLRVWITLSKEQQQYDAVKCACVTKYQASFQNDIRSPMYWWIDVITKNKFLLYSHRLWIIFCGEWWLSF